MVLLTEMKEKRRRIQAPWSQLELESGVKLELESWSQLESMESIEVKELESLESSQSIWSQ